MQQPTLEEPGFPDGFDPVDSLRSYLRAHNTAQWAVVLVIFFAILALAIGWEPQVERDAIPFDDEPLDDEDRAAIAEANSGRVIPLDEYFAQRHKQAT